MLRAWQAWQRTEQRAVGIDGDGWVFTDADGQPVHPHAISQAFERLARRACVPVIRLHDVRHTHATLLIASGVPAKVVRELTPEEIEGIRRSAQGYYEHSRTLLRG